MANSFYYFESGTTARTLFVGDGTDTIYLVRGKTEHGEQDVPRKITSEHTPNKYADQFRGVVYTPREYGFTILVKRDTGANLESSMATLRGYFDAEKGAGTIKRVTFGGNTRCLDCILSEMKTTPQGPAAMDAELLFHADNPWWRSETATTVNTNIHGSVTVTNPGFEIGGTGGDFNGGAEADDGTSDTFTAWTNAGVNDVAGDKVEATATAQAGTYAVKLTYTAAQTRVTSADITVTAGSSMSLTFQARGDASVAGQYSIYDVTNAADIFAKATTGVTAAAYALVTKTFTVPAGCVKIALVFYSPAAAGVAYVDAVALAYTVTKAPIINGGQIASWPVITLTGIVATPTITNSNGDYITVNFTTINADDTLTIDCRPNGDYRRSVYYRANGTGTRAYKALTSASRYITLPTGTNDLTLDATSGTAAVVVSYHLYYGGLY